LPVEREAVDEGRLELVRLNRPEKRNALDLAMVEQLLAAIPATPPPARRAYLIYGTGTVFSAGADRASVDAAGQESHELRDALYRLYHRLVEQPLPVMAWLNGPAIGAGALLATLCDLRVVSSSARLAVPAGALGITIAPWLVARIAGELGVPLTRLLLLGGAAVEAGRLLEHGFALRQVGSAEEAIEAAMGLVRQDPAVAQAHRLAIQQPGAIL
jgi:enoyl-CoA hydratase